MEIFSWLGTVMTSVLCGIIITLVVQFYFIKKMFLSENPRCMPNLPIPHFSLPEVILQKLQDRKDGPPSESCVPMNVLLQFLFHELRDTERVRKWFRNKLTFEFEELLSRSAVGRMFSGIKIRDITLGSEFPVINSIAIADVNINEKFSVIDSIDLKLDLSYNGGFRLIVDANMMLGKMANLSIKVGCVSGEARLQFTRLPYSHWSFSFYKDPYLQLDVESHFQGRPMPQITALISSQIRKAIRKKHTLPNYKLRYKPFFTVADEPIGYDAAHTCSSLEIHIHRISRLPSMPNYVTCLIGVDPLPWIDIMTFENTKYYLIDVTVTKIHNNPLGITCKQETRLESGKNIVVVERSSQAELVQGDIILSIDGHKVTYLGQVPKLLRAAAVQATIRVERLARDDIDASGASSLFAHSDEGKDCSPEKKKDKTFFGKTPIRNSSIEPQRLITTKVFKNNQIIFIDEKITCTVLDRDKYLNITVRGSDDTSAKQEILAYLNIPLSKILLSSDFLHCCQLKPPDPFTTSNSKTHELASHNGFIPLLTYGDIVFTAEPAGVTSRDRSATLNSSFETSSAVNKPSPSHEFSRTHLQSSVHCQFCGKKIWLKDAEKCRLCNMTCHKKCVSKCISGTVCNGSTPVQGVESQMKNLLPDSSDEILRRNSVCPEIVTTEVTPPTPTTKSSFKSGTKRGLSGLIASVASAGKGLKRVGSAHSLQLPDDSSTGEATSSSLPPSPQLTPSPSRKPSLPLELSEDISVLLQSLLQQGSDHGDMMCIAKATGKSLYEDLELPQRKEKIQEMMGKLQAAIDRELEVRGLLEKDGQDATKTAFLVGKSDEKTQALTVLMLHFCAALQHIQDHQELHEGNARAE